MVSGESEDLKKENVVALENNVVLLLLLIDDTIDIFDHVFYSTFYVNI